MPTRVALTEGATRSTDGDSSDRLRGVRGPGEPRDGVGRLVSGILGAGAARGVDRAAALAAVGVDLDVLHDPAARIPMEQEERLWEEPVARSGDACFGLHAQIYMPAGAVDVLDFVVRSSPTLAVAFDNLIRFNRLAHDLAEFELTRDGVEARLVQAFPGDYVGDRKVRTSNPRLNDVLTRHVFELLVERETKLELATATGPRKLCSQTEIIRPRRTCQCLA